MNIAGIEIGGTKLQIVLGNELGTIAQHVRRTVDPGSGAEAIRRTIGEVLAGFGKLDAIGVGFGGPIDRETGTVWTSYHVDGWTGFHIRAWLSQFTDGPVLVENDANVAALAEAILGEGENDRVVFYATLGSGVGGGLTIAKEIYHGVRPGELEFGHVRLAKDGRTVQSSCAGWAVNEKIRLAIAKERQSILAQMAGAHAGVEAMALLPAMEAGDRSAIRIFEETMDDLAFGLSHVVHLFHPDSIILGGGLSLMGDPLRRAVAAKLSGYVMDAFHPIPPVKLSRLKADVVPIGALLLVSAKK